MAIKTFVVKRKTNNNPTTYIVKDYMNVFYDEDYTHSKSGTNITISNYIGNKEDVSIINSKLYTYLPKIIK